jgi:HSP20 family protein
MAWPQTSGFRPLWDWDPFRELDRAQAEVGELFARTNDSYVPGYPPVNVWASDEGVVVTAELPGVDPAKLDISVVGDQLTLAGSRPADEPKEGERFLRSERGHGDFERALRLPFKVQADQVQARFKDGILFLELPKASAERPRKIEVANH